MSEAMAMGCPYCGTALAGPGACGGACGAGAGGGGCALLCCPGCGRSVPHPARSRLAHRLARWLARRRTRRAQRPATPLTLATLPVGAPARIDGIGGNPALAQQLAGLGVVPGTAVRLRRRRPAVVLELDETTLALDAAVAAQIAVSTAGP